MVEHDAIGLLLGRFGLTSVRTHLPEVEAAAQNGSWTYRQFLRELLEAEETARARRRLKRLLKDSQLPEAKTAANLELKRFSLARHLTNSAMAPFAKRRRTSSHLAYLVEGKVTSLPLSVMN